MCHGFLALKESVIIINRGPSQDAFPKTVKLMSNAFFSGREVESCGGLRVCRLSGKEAKERQGVRRDYDF